jgi:hypothetical protein
MTEIAIYLSNNNSEYQFSQFSNQKTQTGDWIKRQDLTYKKCTSLAKINIAFE